MACSDVAWFLLNFNALLWWINFHEKNRTKSRLNLSLSLCTAKFWCLLSKLCPKWSITPICTWTLKNQVGTGFLACEKSISKLIFASYTVSKNPVRKRLNIQFVKLDFSKLIFQKSSTDQQGVGAIWYT